MKIRSVFATVALLASVLPSVTLAANRGSCAADADLITMTTREQVVSDVGLTEEYDASTGKYEFLYRQVLTNSVPWVTNNLHITNHVHYFKVKLQRGKEYSVWLTGADGLPLTSTNIVISSIEPEPATSETQMEPGAGFDAFGGKWGSMMVLTADSWWVDPEEPEFSDPLNWHYLIRVSGAKGETASLHFRIGNALPVGIDDNPLPIMPALNEKSDGPRAFVPGDNAFKYQVSFKEGRRYLFATTGGTSNAVYGVAALSTGKTLPYDGWTNAWNASICFDSDGEWSGLVAVTNAATNAVDATFGLRYRMVPARSITQHDFAEIAVGTNGVTFAPGRLSVHGNDAFDAIVDEGLFAFNAAKGEKYVAWTEGAVTNLMMRVYDAKGNVIHQNADCGQVSNYNVRCGFTPTASGRFYIGVCQDLDDYDREQALGSNVVLKVDTLKPQPGAPDRWDCDDDDYYGATMLLPAPATSNDLPTAVDVAVSNDWHRLDLTDWYDVFAINGRTGYTYAVSYTNANAEEAHNGLSARVFVMNGTSESSVKTKGSFRLGATNALTFVATENKTYYVRLSVSGAPGLYHPDYRVHSTVFDTKTGTKPAMGMLTVVTRGTDLARWNVDGAATKKSGFSGGTTLLLPAGTYEVAFSSVSGFSTPESQRVTVVAGQASATVYGVYNDLHDHDDDELANSPKWNLTSAWTTCSRTLWTDDPQDGCAFKAKDGLFYDFELSRNVGENRTAGDAVFTVCSDTVGTPVNDAAGKPVVDVTSVYRLKLAKGQYYVSVHHRDAENPSNTYYQIRGRASKIGEIKFAKNAVKAKRASGIAKVSVKRTASDGRVRVKYCTAADTAKPGEQYVAQSGILEWDSGDKRDKTISVTLIPDLFSGDGSVTAFKIQLKAMGEDEMVRDEYPAQITLDECTVTVSDSKGKSKEELYAKTVAKVASAKNVSEPLTVGSYYGVLMARVDADSVRTNAEEFAGILTNGCPQLASLSFAATAAEKLSAKVNVAGKKYSLKNGSWGLSTNGCRVCTFEQAGLSLSIAVNEGESLADWSRAGGEATLKMDVPDAKKGGVQSGILYQGEIFRDNSKVQAYYDEIAANFAGYYTIALKAKDAIEYSAGMPMSPAGNGYMGVTVDSKGKAKLVGQLADGTKISQSANACAVVYEDVTVGSNVVQKTPVLYIPVFAAKGTYCFGGILRLYRKSVVRSKPDGSLQNLDPNRVDFDTVADSSVTGVARLVWNNDDARLSYEGTKGWRQTLAPVGGWYDAVFNLHAYYKRFAFGLDTATVSEFPSQALPEGFSYVETSNVQPGSTEVSLGGNALNVPKKSIVKNGGSVSFDSSVNPCDVKIKFKRATGVVSGSFMLWAESDVKQKSVGSIKHSGIVILQRDDAGVLSEDVFSAGFFTYSAKISREADLVDEAKGKYASRKWTLSLPFNILGVDQGDVNWWAGDAGKRE